MTKKRRILSVIMAVALVASMMFAMTANTFAATNGSATCIVQIYDMDDDVSYVVDSATVASGQSVYDAINGSFDYYEPAWEDWVDVFNQQPTKHLISFVGYDEVNVDHQYNADGSGWSNDWGWRYTVNGSEPKFDGEPNHGKMMNQYIIQDGDQIVLKYVYTESAWDKDGNMTKEIIHE